MTEGESMANLTRYDPFDTGLEPFDDLFRGFFRPVRMDKELPQFKMDVKEDDKAYTVHADLPGVKKEDIHVSIEGNTVAITAETRSESEQKEGEKVLKRERSYGKVFRSFALASEIDEAASSARYNDGVLELVLPKKTAAASKRLTVE
jgi:HSP20 family protein